MKIDATLSITRPSGDYVSISIRDEASRITFLELNISHEEFSRALGSLAERPALDCNVRGLENVGKTVEVQTFIIHPNTEIPNKYLDYATAEAALIEAAVAQGFGGDEWIISAHPALRSQQGSGKLAGRPWYRMERKRYVASSEVTA